MLVVPPPTNGVIPVEMQQFGEYFLKLIYFFMYLRFKKSRKCGKFGKWKSRTKTFSGARKRDCFLIVPGGT